MRILHPENLAPQPTDHPVPPRLAAEGIVRIAGDGAGYNAAGLVMSPPSAVAREAQRRGWSIGQYVRFADGAIGEGASSEGAADEDSPS